MKTDLYNLKNEKVDTIEVPDSVFGVAWKPALVQQVVNAQLANLRRPWAHAKGRSEVRGGGRKPWRQKGTGRSRQGSIRSPLWRSGGKAHGPSKERDYSQKVNKKMKRVALFSVLSKKLKDNEVKFFNNLEIESPKTNILSRILRGLLALKKNSKKYDVLLIPALESKNVFRAAANLGKTAALRPESLNVYDILRHKNIFIAQEAAEAISKHFKV
ncbi:MAG: 50S ribosomal protein L4 [Candidatus Liptonbacteria bacterium]|nr:50S ribosomal protein L4 [Candidatus Liptonbacteria bacterium]